MRSPEDLGEYPCNILAQYPRVPCGHADDLQRGHFSTSADIASFCILTQGQGDRILVVNQDDTLERGEKRPFPANLG
jgi:hypothetical protein